MDQATEILYIIFKVILFFLIFGLWLGTSWFIFKKICTTIWAVFTWIFGRR